MWPGFLTLSSAEEEDEEEAMEHSHIFPVFSPNGSTWSPGQHPSEVAQGCPLGPLPVIYYSILLCLGLPGKRRVFYASVSNPVHVSFCVILLIFLCWSLHQWAAGVMLCILICCAHVCLSECVSSTAAPECHSSHTHC